MANTILKMGSTGKIVRYLQQSLTNLRYYSGPIDGMFGSKTQTAVKLFQKSKGLVVDGIVGNKTWVAIYNSLQNPIVLPILKIGSTGEAVKYLQELLTKLGYTPGVIDGTFGSKTQTAVKLFQTNKGLVPDGIVGINTWNVLAPTVYIPKFQNNNLPPNTTPVFATAWKSSPDGSISVCIEGRGPAAVEEGIGKIYFKNSLGDKWSYSMIENSTKQFSPKCLEFWNNTNLFIIVGFGYGTVSMGGNVYNLDLNTGIVSIIYATMDIQREVVNMIKTANDLKIKINVYEDSNYLKSHFKNLYLSTKVIDIK